MGACPPFLPFPPPSLQVLRYSSLGPVKSFCHHRLLLLEQKFNLHVMLNADKVRACMRVWV